MAEMQNTEMPFLDHLEELRWRILWSLLALVIGVAIAFAFVVKGDVIAILQRPIQPFLHGHKLVYTHPSDPFSIIMTASLALGTILALPVILYQAWRFLAPALYAHEKRLVIPVVVGATALFAAGVSLAFFVVLPLTLNFLLGLQTESIEPMITAGDYFSFAVNMSLTFGAVFELPIAILALTALGLVTPQFLSKFRRHAAVLCIVAAAFITPGQDIASLAALSLPLYLLYELSVGMAFVVHRRKTRRAAADAAAGDYDGARA
jgi:sec-independent protein translocase protein TatC